MANSRFQIFFGMVLLSISIPNFAATTEKQCVVSNTGNRYLCEVGKAGVVKDKKEGDNATPAGSFFIRQIFYRKDKLSAQQIKSVLKLRNKGFLVNALTIDDGWSDDINSPLYNQHILISNYTRSSKQLSYEKLWRDDNLYDVIAVIGYNDAPIIKGNGSAIFMHVMRKDLSGKPLPTVGCVSLELDNLMQVLTNMMPSSLITIPLDSDTIYMGKVSNTL